MISKSKRLKRDDFQGLNKRKIIRGVLFDVSYIPAKESHFACIIQKKRIKLAVVRNKVKRKVYSAVERSLLKNPHTIIIYPKQTILNAPYKNIITEMQSIFDTL